jgi:hypothetical protein
MKIRKTNDNRFVFFCPGCQCGHWFKTEGPGPVWTFNEDMEKPTIRASILVKGHLQSHREEGETIKDVHGICHSIITDGNIQFLPDCTHELSGKTVPLEDF